LHDNSPETTLTPQGSLLPAYHLTGAVIINSILRPNIYVHTLGTFVGDISMPSTAQRKHEKAPRRPTNVSLNAELLEQAKELGVNVSRACERGLAIHIAEEKAQRWLEENRAALESSNQYVERHGLPLARYRQF
jgi:antitoxin CcdA